MEHQQNISARDIKCVAFDLDGTLVDSVPDLTAATRATLAQLGLPDCSEQQVRGWIGNGAPMLIRRAMAFASAQPVTDEMLADAMPIFMQHYQHYLHQYSRLYPNVKQVLTTLRQQGLHLAVVTNKPQRFAEPLLAEFDIADCFELILGGDALPKMKPDPLPLQHLLSHFNLPASALLMVGDSRNDILAAKAAGVVSIGLTYGYNYGEDIALSGPEAVCEHFSDILTILNISPTVTEQ